MLVLSRRRGESIIVGDDIEIRVLEVRGSQVKIGIQAPARHTVHRKEVYIAIRKKAHRRAAGRRAQPGVRPHGPTSKPQDPGNGDNGAPSRYHGMDGKGQ